MKNLKAVVSLGFATLLVISAVAAAFGEQTQAAPKQATRMEAAARTTTYTARRKHQRMAAHLRHHRHPEHMLRTSAKHTKRVPKAKSLSKQSY